MNWADSNTSQSRGTPVQDNPEPSRGVTPEGVETRGEELICCVCLTSKPKTDFYKKNRNGRLDSSCKACRIIKSRERTLGVTEQQYRELERKQNGRCGICRNRLRSRRYKAFAVDHCHRTGRVRGLLCTNCNTALGLLKDDPERMLRASEWVKG